MSYDIFIVNNFVVKHGFKNYGSAKLFFGMESSGWWTDSEM